MKRNLIIHKRNLFNFYTRAFLAMILLAGGSFGQKQVTRTNENYYAHLKTEHAAVVKNYIRNNAALRPAQTADCKNKFGLDSLRQSAGKSAHPFYAVADFNRDRISDFAVVLYGSNKKADAGFTVLIFDGSKSGTYRLAHKSENADLREGGIWTYGFSTDGKRKTVTAGIFETDDCFWIEWDGKKYVEHSCAEVEN